MELLMKDSVRDVEMNLDNLFQRVDRTGRLLQPGGEAGGHGEGATGAAHAADGGEPRAAQPLPGDPDLQQRPLHPAQPGEPTPQQLGTEQMPQKVASELHPKVHNHGEGPY